MRSRSCAMPGLACPPVRPGRSPRRWLLVVAVAALPLVAALVPVSAPASASVLRREMPATAGGSAVLSPSLILTPDVAGAAAAEYTVTFTLSASGELPASTGAIQLAGPPGTTFSPAAGLVDHTHPSQSDTNLLEGYNAYISDHGSVFTMIVGKEMYAGDTLTLILYGVASAVRSGIYGVRLWTSSDPTPVTMPLHLVAPTSAVSAPAVHLSSTTPGATDVTYTVDLTTSSPGGAMPPGACLAADGGAIDVAFPLGTGNLVPVSEASSGSIESTLTDLSDASGSGPPECGYAFYESPWVSSDGAVVTFPLSAPVSSGAKLALQFTDVTNPSPAGTYHLLLWTTSDPQPVAVTYQVGSSTALQSKVSAQSVVVAPPSAGETAHYSVHFTASPQGSLTAGSGVIYLLAAAGTSFGVAGVKVTDTSTGASGNASGLEVGPDGTSELVWFPTPVAVRGGDHVVVDVSGATDGVAGSYGLRIWTSGDPGVSLSSYSLSGRTVETAVTAGSLSISNGSATAWSALTYSATFALSGSGALQSGTDAVYLEAPASVDLSSGNCVRSYCLEFEGLTVAVTDLSDPSDAITVASEEVPPNGPASVLAVTFDQDVPAGTLLTLTVSGVPLTGRSAAGALTVWTSQDTRPVPIGVPASAGGFVFGDVTAFVGVSDVSIELCPTRGGACTDTVTLPKTGSGQFAALVPPGTYTATAIPPSNLTQYNEQVSGPVTVTAGGTAPLVDLSFTPAIPAGGTFTGFPVGAQTGISPSVYASFPSTYEIAGCKNGYGLLSVSGTDRLTGDPISRAFPLVETPPGSGTYLAQLSPLGPIEGVATARQGIVCPGQSHLVPTGGAPAGGSTVFLTGSGFTGATRVLFGTKVSPSFTVESGSVIESTAPAGSGTVTVSVDEKGGGTHAVGSFTYFGVSHISPSTGPFAGGTVVTIHGEGFNDVKAVAFGLLPATSFTVVNSGEIRATAPAGVGTIDVQVVNGFGLSAATTADYFTYEGKSGPLGGVKDDLSVTQSGGGLDEGTGDGSVQGFSIQIGGVCSDPGQLQSDQQATGISWQDLCNAADDIINSFGPGGALQGVFESGVIALGVGALAGLLGAAVPFALALGAITFVILLVFGLWQFFNLFIDPSGTVVDTTGNPIEGATATILRGAPGGTFSPVPGDGSISPDQNPETTGASGGFDWLALAGTYEISASAPGCHAPGKAAQPSVTTKPFPLPPPAVGLLLTLECPGSKPPRPTVTAVTPGTEPSTGGLPVDVIGGGFADATSVHFGKVAASGLHVISPDSIEVTPPAGTSTVDVTVSGPGGTSIVSKADRFQYVRAIAGKGIPRITRISPATSSLAGGSTVTIAGRSLGSVTSVSFGSTASLRLKVESATKVLALVPAGLFSGSTEVIVNSPAGSSVPTSASRFVYTEPTVPHLPRAPAGLSAIAGDGSVTLRWRPADSTGSVTGVRVQWMVLGGRSVTQAFDGGSDRQAVAGLLDGRRYRFRVSLGDTTGYGPWSVWSGDVVPLPAPLTAVTAHPAIGPSGLGHDASVVLRLGWARQPAGTAVRVCLHTGHTPVASACRGGVVRTLLGHTVATTFVGLAGAASYVVEAWRSHVAAPRTLSRAVVLLLTGTVLSASVKRKAAGASLLSAHLEAAGTRRDSRGRSSGALVAASRKHSLGAGREAAHQPRRNGFGGGEALPPDAVPVEVCRKWIAPAARGFLHPDDGQTHVASTRI